MLHRLQTRRSAEGATTGDREGDGAVAETPRIAAFFDELKLLGFAEGKNLNVAPGGFNLRNDQYAEYARTLVKSNPDVIFSVGDAPTLAAKEANQTIPVVGFLSPNMVAMGVIRTFARPGGNVTGVGTLPVDGKRQELLMEARAWRVEDRNPGGPDVHLSRATPTT